MGNPRKPAAIRRAEGNRGHSPIPREPQGHGKPTVPDYLSPEQVGCFKAILKNLPAGIICSADQSTLERAAVAWATYRECVRSIGRTGLIIKGHDERPARHPLWIIMRGAAEEMDRATASLGMSPLARTRLSAPDEVDDDPLSVLMQHWDARNAAEQAH